MDKIKSQKNEEEKDEGTKPGKEKRSKQIAEEENTVKIK